MKLKILAYDSPNEDNVFYGFELKSYIGFLKIQTSRQKNRTSMKNIKMCCSDTLWS